MIDGQEKEFVEAHVNLKQMRKCISFLSRVEEELLNTDEQFEEAIALISDIFKSEEVNYDSVMEGLSPDDWNEKIMDIIFKVADGETKKKGKSSRLQLIEMRTKMAMEAMKNPQPKED